MNVQKAQNDGKHLQQTNGIITFLTCNGWRTPKERRNLYEIWNFRVKSRVKEAS